MFSLMLCDAPKRAAGATGGQREGETDQRRWSRRRRCCARRALRWGERWPAGASQYVHLAAQPGSPLTDMVAVVVERGGVRARAGWSRSFRSATPAPPAEMAGLCCPGLAASTRTQLAPSPARARLAPLDPLVDLAPPTAPRPAPARPCMGTRAGPTPTARALARAAVRRVLEASHFRPAPSHADADLSASSPSAGTDGPGGEISCSPSTTRRAEGWARVRLSLGLLRRLDLRRRAACARLSLPCCSSRPSSASTEAHPYSCYLQGLQQAALGHWSCGRCSARRLSRPAAARSATLARALARVGPSGRRCSFRASYPSSRRTGCRAGAEGGAIARRTAGGRVRRGGVAAGTSGRRQTRSRTSKRGSTVRRCSSAS